MKGKFGCKPLRTGLKKWLPTDSKPISEFLSWLKPFFKDLLNQFLSHYSYYLKIPGFRFIRILGRPKTHRPKKSFFFQVFKLELWTMVLNQNMFLNVLKMIYICVI